MNFKLYFPAGYRTDPSVAEEILDLYIITEDCCVYFATLYTVRNITLQMEKNKQTYFWAENMVIIRDLKESTINTAIEDIVCSDNPGSIVSKIGAIEMFQKHDFYSQLNVWTTNTPTWLMAGCPPVQP